MKKVLSFTDIDFIVRFKCDVWTEDGGKIPFVQFLNLPLIKILEGIQNRTWLYDQEVF